MSSHVYQVTQDFPQASNARNLSKLMYPSTLILQAPQTKTVNKWRLKKKMLKQKSGEYLPISTLKCHTKFPVTTTNWQCAAITVPTRLNLSKFKFNTYSITLTTPKYPSKRPAQTKMNVTLSTQHWGFTSPSMRRLWSCVYLWAQPCERRHDTSPRSWETLPPRSRRRMMKEGTHDDGLWSGRPHR